MGAVQVLNGLSYGVLLLVLALGLALIFGLRGVFNFAHGALYMLAAYIAGSLIDFSSFWVAIIVGPLALAALGYVCEFGAFRRLTRREPIEVALITYGAALVIETLVRIFWGTGSRSVAAPAGFGGSTSVFGHQYPTYRFLVIGVGLLCALAVLVWLRFSRIGLFVRAASHDGTTSAIMGVNVDRVSAVVVAVGFGLAGVAGALAGPYLTLTPDMDLNIMVISLIVVCIGGLGSIGGAMIAAIVLGLLQAAGTVYAPSLVALVPYAALVVVLVVKPTGLAGRASA